MTGALILVAALVIIFSEMFSGPRPKSSTSEVAPAQPASAGPPLRTYNLELDGGSTRAAQDQSTLVPQSNVAAVEPEPAREAPPPATPMESSAAAPPVAVVSAAAQPPASRAQPTPPAEPERPARSTGARWWTQLGSFSSRENADRLARDLRGRGFGIEVTRVKSGSKELFRVRAGPVDSREAAVNLQKRLAAAGHKAALVAP
jgi:cell division septation protein DedD